MAKDDKRSEEVNGASHAPQGTRPDFSVPPPRKRLPKELQDTLNDEEKMWEILYEGKYVQCPPTQLKPLHHILVLTDYQHTFPLKFEY